MTDDVSPAEWPRIRRGNPFEEHTVGRRYEHEWGRTVTDADNVLFTTATVGYNPRYLDAEAARAAGHPSAQINPLVVWATVFGISCEDLSEIAGPFLGGEELRYGVPVYAGDTLTASSSVIDARESSSNPSRGIVTWETVGVNQRGERVVSYRRTNLVAKDSGDFRQPLEGYAEDFVVGDRFRHSRSKTVGADLEMGLLTPMLMNAVEGHFSDGAMAATPFGGRINFGGMTLSLTIGLATQDTTQHATGEVGLDGISFPASVRSGDTIAASTEVLAVEDRGTVADVTFRHYGTNQDGVIVCRVDRIVTIAKRPV